MSKKILHFQIPINNNDKYPLVRLYEVNLILTQAKRMLPRYYKIIASPFDISINKKVVIINKNNAKNLLNNEKWLNFIINKVEAEGYTVKLIK